MSVRSEVIRPERRQVLSETSADVVFERESENPMLQPTSIPPASAELPPSDESTAPSFFSCS